MDTFSEENQWVLASEPTGSAINLGLARRVSKRMSKTSVTSTSPLDKEQEMLARKMTPGTQARLSIVDERAELEVRLAATVYMTA